MHCSIPGADQNAYQVRGAYYAEILRKTDLSYRIKGSVWIYKDEFSQAYEYHVQRDVSKLFF
jgi:hypothetical protein